MPRKKKEVHGTPEHYGICNMSEAYTERKKDDLETMEKVNPIYHIGLKNRQNYKGQWDEESLQKAVNEYFDYCLEKSVKPDKSGLQLWLGISTSQYYAWASNPDKYGFKTEILDMAHTAMRISYVQRGETNPTFNMFLLKAAHNMVETQKVEINATGQVNTSEISDAISKLGLDE